MSLSTMIKTGDTATLFYAGDDETMTGTVSKINRDTSGQVIRVGITPEGTDHTAWFAPKRGRYGLYSVGGFTRAYVMR